MARLLSVFFHVSILVLVTTGYAQTIERPRIQSILETLAADEMMGREAGTPSERKAADYIAGQFAAIGLSPYEGLESFLQPFPIVEVTAGSGTLELNGQAVPSDQFLVISDRETNEAQDAKAFTTMVIGKDDDPRRAFFVLQDIQKPTLILIDPAHTAIFQRIAQFLTRPRQSLASETDKSALLILTEAGAVESLKLSYTNQVSPLTIMNVVGVLPGISKPDEWVLFSAHYDHLGILPAVDGDEIANGADDDASGTTAVIALAEYYKKRGNNARSILFAAFTAEEKGLFGSRYLASQVDADKIVAGINIEMIGKLSKFGPKETFLTGFDQSTLGEILQKNMAAHDYTIHPDPYPQQALFLRSDNASFVRKGVPAHTVSSSQIDKDSYYHTVADEVATLDLDNMTAIIQALAVGTATIVDGTVTPTRIEASDPSPN